MFIPVPESVAVALMLKELPSTYRLLYSGETEIVPTVGAVLSTMSFVHALHVPQLLKPSLARTFQ